MKHLVFVVTLLNRSLTLSLQVVPGPLLCSLVPEEREEFGNALELLPESLIRFVVLSVVLAQSDQSILFGWCLFTSLQTLLSVTLALEKLQGFALLCGYLLLTGKIVCLLTFLVRELLENSRVWFAIRLYWRRAARLLVGDGLVGSRGLSFERCLAAKLLFSLIFEKDEV